MNEDLIHIQSSRSWQNGQITALCGFTADTAKVDIAWFGFWGGKRCPECDRIRECGE